MKAGDTVTIYHDPISKTNAEGQAVLVEHIDNTLFWNVEFTDEPGETYLRQLIPERNGR